LENITESFWMFRYGRESAFNELKKKGFAGKSRLSAMQRDGSVAMTPGVTAAESGAEDRQPRPEA